jgi:hypothetical protein
MIKKEGIAIGTALLLALTFCVALPAQERDQLPADYLVGTHPQLHAPGALTKARLAATTNGGTTGTTATAAVTGTPGVDTLPNWNGKFTAAGYDPFGNPNRKWVYNMAGTPPESGKTTVFDAPIIPVSLDLRNYDGSVRYVNGKRLYSDATQYVVPVLNSPVFQNARYSSSERPTQFTDAVQLAEFGDRAEDNWHTLLSPSVKTPRVMTLIRGTYEFALNADGTCCAFVLVDANTFGNALFPSTYPVDTSTVIGAAELAGDMTTQDVTTLLLPNTFLYVTVPANCCILGYHSIDSEPGIPANGNLLRFYVMNYSSWITPGLFGPGWGDVTALSHEIAETFNDPLVAFDGVHNITPWWLSPNGNCQDTLEVGDVIEGLPNFTYPITMHGYTYHPQNEALLPWFEFRSPSNALHRAYSYPDDSVLPNLSPLENVNCVP